MSTTAITCPKCAYVRQPTDTAPDYECPKCGVIYSKATATLTRDEIRDLHRQSKADTRRRNLVRIGTALRHPKTIAVLVAAILATAATILGWRQYVIHSAKLAVTNKLVDPQSANFKDIFVRSDKVCGEVNAKNRMGGYVGFNQFIARKTPDGWWVLIDKEPAGDAFLLCAMGRTIKED